MFSIFRTLYAIVENVGYVENQNLQNTVTDSVETYVEDYNSPLTLRPDLKYSPNLNKMIRLDFNHIIQKPFYGRQKSTYGSISNLLYENYNNNMKKRDQNRTEMSFDQLYSQNFIKYEIKVPAQYIKGPLYFIKSFDAVLINKLRDYGCYCKLLFNEDAFSNPSFYFDKIKTFNTDAGHEVDIICKHWLETRYCHTELLLGKCFTETLPEEYVFEAENPGKCRKLENNDCATEICSTDLQYSTVLKNHFSDPQKISEFLKLPEKNMSSAECYLPQNEADSPKASTSAICLSVENDLSSQFDQVGYYSKNIFVIHSISPRIDFRYEEQQTFYLENYKYLNYIPADQHLTSEGIKCVRGRLDKSNCYCPGRQGYNMNVFYFFVNLRVNYHHAQEFCDTMGMKLMKLTTLREFFHLKNYLKNLDVGPDINLWLEPKDEMTCQFLNYNNFDLLNLNLIENANCLNSEAFETYEIARKYFICEARTICRPDDGKTFSEEKYTYSEEPKMCIEKNLAKNYYKVNKLNDQHEEFFVPRASKINESPLLVSTSRRNFYLVPRDDHIQPEPDIEFRFIPFDNQFIFNKGNDFLDALPVISTYDTSVYSQEFNDYTTNLSNNQDNTLNFILDYRKYENQSVQSGSISQNFCLTVSKGFTK